MPEPRTRWLAYSNEPLDHYTTQADAEAVASALALQNRGIVYLIERALLDTVVTVGTSETPVITPSIWEGLVHHWKCDETVDNADRVDSVGSDDLVVFGTTGNITDGTGVRNASVVTPGAGSDRYMRTTPAVGNDITFAFWGYVPASGSVFWFNKTSTGDAFRIQISPGIGTTFLQAGIYDPITGIQFSGEIDIDGNTVGDLWMLWIVRLDNLNRTGKFRFYGMHTDNGVDTNISNYGPWTNSFTTLDFEVGRTGGSYTEVELDEIMIWDRQITDEECDTLGTGALPD